MFLNYKSPQMELSESVKEIDKKVVKNEYKKAIESLQTISVEYKIDIHSETTVLLSRLMEINKFKRNTHDDKDYLIRIQDLREDILSLKTDLVSYINNPETIPTKSNPTTSTAAIQSEPQAAITSIKKSTNWFKAILLLLICVSGLAMMYTIIFSEDGNYFQSASMGAVMVAIWGAKVYDDKVLYQREKERRQLM